MPAAMPRAFCFRSFEQGEEVGNPGTHLDPAPGRATRPSAGLLGRPNDKDEIIDPWPLNDEAA